MTTIFPTTIAVRSERVRWVVRATLFAAALALAVSPFGHPAIARADFKQEDLDRCMNDTDYPADYCCEHAGGVVRSGACIDPEDLKFEHGLPGQPAWTVPPERAPQATLVDPGPPAPPTYWKVAPEVGPAATAVDPG